MEEDSFVPEQTTETLHFPKYDLIRNLTADALASTQKLAEQFRDGIPSQWQRYSQGSAIGERYVDSQDNPQYIAKIRNLTPEMIRKSREITDPKALKVLFGNMDKVTVNAVDSLLNELKLNPAIKNILRDEEVKRLVSAYGFQDIRYIEPLLGIINKETGQKTMVYNFINGYNLTKQATIDEGNESSKTEYQGLVDALRGFFSKYGIQANDLSEDQFLVQDMDGKKRLYLLDTEQYIRKNNEEFPKDTT